MPHTCRKIHVAIDLQRAACIQCGMTSGGNNLVLRSRETQLLYGTVQAPPSKSYSHRAILIASLDGRTRVINPLSCDDTRNTVTLCRKLGASIGRIKGGFAVRGIGGSPSVSGKSVHVGESGTLLRFCLPLLALNPRPVTVCGKGTLLSRTNRQVVDVLKSWGIDIAGQGGQHLLPIRINATGSLKGGRAIVDAGVTSQVVSALLIAAPFAEEDTILELSGRLVSRPYVDITIDVLKWAGIAVENDNYRSFRVKCGQRIRPHGAYTVHGDWSSAAFLIAAAAITRSDVTVADLVKDCQGDRRIAAILRRMGAKITHSGSSVHVKGPFDLRGVDIDGADVPDLVPILATIACFAKGVTRIRNVAHLAHKESNRLAKPAGELQKLGARISSTSDELIIRQSQLHGGNVSACKDHRIAMSLAVAGLRINDGVRIAGAECISKSYPGFVSHMRALGARIQG